MSSRPRNSSIYSLVRSNARINNGRELLLPSTPSYPSHTHLFSHMCQNLRLLRNFETNLVEGDHIFRTSSAGSQLLLQPAPKQVPEEAAEDLGIPYVTILNLLKLPVHMLLYKIGNVHQFQQPDFAQSVAFLQSCMDSVSSDSDCFIHKAFADECVVQVYGLVNAQQSYLGTENPRKIQQHDLNRET